MWHAGNFRHSDVCVGLTALQSLSLVGCCMKVVFPDPEWLRVLRRTSELELSGGVITIFFLDIYLEHGSFRINSKTRSKPVMPCRLQGP